MFLKSKIYYSRTLFSGRIVLLIALFSIVHYSGQPSAKEVGKFSYKGAPENLNGRTLKINSTMVAMSENIFAKAFSSSKDSVADTPSIFFVIDNSGSMSTSNPTDKNGNRFTVTSSLIDTLQKNYPGVEVGLAVFGTWLWFDPNDRPFFVKTPAQENGAYVPLLQLGKNYAMYGSKTGYTILKEILDTAIKGTGQNKYVGLSYITTNKTLTATSTHINAGFDAAKHAFLNSLNADKKKNQYIIFLSDGAPRFPENADSLAFAKGTSTPTTFTIFFQSGTSNTVPKSIADLTTNVQTNGYSSSNPKSAAWSYNNRSYSELMSFVMKNILTVITSNSALTPKAISIGSAQTTGWTNGVFTFKNLFPLIGPITEFNYSITYDITKNLISIKDTIHAVKFSAQLDQATLLPTDSFDVRFWDRNLSFHTNAITLATTAAPAVIPVTDGMDSLEIRFASTPGTAGYTYTKAAITIYNVKGTRDRETLTLTRTPPATFFTGTFKRVLSKKPVANNTILEHETGDTLIAVFRNTESPHLPLDTLLLSVPLNISPFAFLDSAVTRDTSGNALLDRIDLYFNKPFELSTEQKPYFTIRNGNPNVSFFIDSIVKNPNSPLSYYLYIKETSTRNPQSHWTPEVTIKNLQGADDRVVTCKDGAPPVILKVVKSISGVQAASDTVKVTMSEKVYGASGSFFDPASDPGSVFNAWVYVNNSYRPADSMLAGITQFTRIEENTFYFTMTNGRDLTPENFLNVNAPNFLVRDKAGNFPTPENQKVQVLLKDQEIIVQVMLNPSGSTFRRVDAGTVNFIDVGAQGQVWVQTDNAGVLLSIGNLSVPSLDKEKSRGYIKIYDMAGNVVSWSNIEENIFKDKPAGIVRNFNVYWNGSNKNKMKVAPGIYRIVMTIEYPERSKLKPVRLITRVGIR